MMSCFPCISPSRKEAIRDYDEDLLHGSNVSPVSAVPERQEKDQASFRPAISDIAMALDYLVSQAQTSNRNTAAAVTPNTTPPLSPSLQLNLSFHAIKKKSFGNISLPL
nr:serine/threonine-protein kinase CDL1-like [Ipomoea batatas]